MVGHERRRVHGGATVTTVPEGRKVRLSRCDRGTCDYGRDQSDASFRRSMSAMKLSNRYRLSCGPGAASG